MVHKNQKNNWLGEEPKERFSLVLIGQKRNVNHGIQGENGAAHLRWKKKPFFMMKNDDFSSNLMEEGHWLENEGR